MPNSSDHTDSKIELSQHKTQLWAMGIIITILILLVQGFFTYLITSTGGDIREASHNLVKLTTAVEVQQAQLGFVHLQIEEINKAKEAAAAAHHQYELRLNSNEQRLALHDQWIEAHTN